MAVGTYVPPGEALFSQQVFDYEALTERLNGRRDLVERIVTLVLDEYGDHRERIASRVEAGDAEGLVHAAHRLKGQLLTVGVNAAADAVHRIEQFGRCGTLQHVSAALEEVDAEMERFRGHWQSRMQRTPA